MVHPMCDRPDHPFWRAAFVHGWPWVVQLHRAHGPLAEHRQISGFFTNAIHRGPIRLEPRASGGQTVFDHDDRPVGVLLPRSGDIAQIGAPIFVMCGWGFQWGGAGGWTECRVRYRHAGVLDVSYRFQREIFDEPDIPALDLRVQRLVQAMLDGAEALPLDVRE